MRKGLAVAELREGLRAINCAALAFLVGDATVGELFRMPNGDNEQNLLFAVAPHSTELFDWRLN